MIIYPLAMAFAVIYTGEHYLFDVLLGWLYTAGVLGSFRLVAHLRESRVAPEAALAH